MIYNFQEVSERKKVNYGMCSKCRYKHFFEPAFGTGWVACDIMTEDKSTYENCIFDIPLEIRNNCPGFEKRTLFSFVKSKRPRIIYTKQENLDENSSS